MTTPPRESTVPVVGASVERIQRQEPPEPEGWIALRRVNGDWQIDALTVRKTREAAMLECKFEDHVRLVRIGPSSPAQAPQGGAVPQGAINAVHMAALRRYSASFDGGPMWLEQRERDFLRGALDETGAWLSSLAQKPEQKSQGGTSDARSVLSELGFLEGCDTKPVELLIRELYVRLCDEIQLWKTRAQLCGWDAQKPEAREVPKSDYEIRRQKDGIDEVVAENVSMVHLERMSDSNVWMRFTLADGRGIRVNIFNKRKAKVEILAELE